MFAVCPSDNQGSSLTELNSAQLEKVADELKDFIVDRCKLNACELKADDGEQLVLGRHFAFEIEVARSKVRNRAVDNEG